MTKPKHYDFCANCKKNLRDIEKVLFVEAEIGRCFCNENCIMEYFQPHVEMMVDDHLKLRSEADLSKEEFEKYLGYRALTLTDPDEVWMKETESGDHHYTYIAEYNNEDNKFHYVCITLGLQGEPSFVFFSFPTQDQELLNFYRDGRELLEKPLSADPLSPEYMQWLEKLTPKIKSEMIHRDQQDPEHTDFKKAMDSPMDSLPNLQNWIEYFKEHRSAQDIQEKDYGEFDIFIDPTIEDPDEIWVINNPKDNKIEYCIFMAKFNAGENEGDIDESTQFNMVVVANFIDDAKKGVPQLKIAFSFPSIDAGLVQLFRKGINTVNKNFGMGSRLVA